MNQLPQFDPYLVLVVLVLVLAASFILFARRRRKSAKGDATEYIKALNAFIEGNLDEAIQLFYQTVHRDTENIDAYIRLGDIFRSQGKLERAIKIHRELLVRRHLRQNDQVQIKRSLALDFQEAGYYDKALDVLNQLLTLDTRNIWARRRQVQVYEAKEDWDNAFKFQKLLLKMDGGRHETDKLALYKVEAAKRKFQQSSEKDGRLLLREALKIDPGSAPAHIFLGDSYVREERYEDAIKTWVDFVGRSPQKSHLVFDRLQEVLYATGSYGEIENILEEIHHKAPDNIEVAITLADIRSRKGDLRTAIKMCEGLLEANPQSYFVRLRLVKLYAQNKESDKALQLAVDLSDRSLLHDGKHVCQACQYESPDPQWHCPKCGAWDSFELQVEQLGVKL